MELSLKPTSAKVKDYYKALNQFGHLYVSHEMAVRQAFASLLGSCARPWDWTLVHELRIALPTKKSVIVDGAILTAFRRHHGYWEAKDLKDDLEKEIKNKLAAGYPRKNIIFQTPERAILYQNGARQGLNEDITDPKNLVGLLKRFFEFREPHEEEWEQAVKEFSPRIPEIAAAAKELINKERQTNKAFVNAFVGFVQLCRQAINPNLSDESVEKMLIQHLLTERIFRKVFNNPEFSRRNIIAAEIEKVIDSLTSKHFSRDAFLKDLDYFYRAIEENAKDATDYSEKQGFLNTVYERFFQSFSPKEADTHGIVYTPQPIVNFMVRSVEEILKKEFGKSLADREVHILDPFVGTGNFLVRVMQEIPKTRLQYKYDHELHCNEVMLLPYYIASMNIEHAYLDATGEYKAFEGICLVDTFDMRPQTQMFTETNLERIERQLQSPVFVVLGNPPYNAWQEFEDDKNRNQRYTKNNGVDTRIAETYGKASKATNKNALSDPYVKAFRWASDRIGKEGIVSFVTNSGFLDSVAADGMRKHLAIEFDEIYIFDLGGNVRRNPKLSGTTHNVFGIQVGVSINLLIRHDVAKEKRNCVIKYARLDEFWRKEQKLAYLEDVGLQSSVQWRTLTPDARFNWIISGLQADFSTFLAAKEQIFQINSNGLKSNRDPWIYNFHADVLATNVKTLIAFYEFERERWARTRDKTINFENWIAVDPTKISWSETLKKDLQRNEKIEFDEAGTRRGIYRPFCVQWVYFGYQLNERTYQLPKIYPGDKLNTVICLGGIASTKPFHCLMVDMIPDLHLTGDTQCFPFYAYSENGKERQENITDWALDQFRSHYKDKSITKWDIFYYTYGVLHHPEYRTRYAANLKRELPRIPYAPDFHVFAKTGKRLTELHVDYEKQKEYPLERREKPGEKLNYRVEKMRLSKDKQTLLYNDFLTLTGIPKETYDYRLGNRSALEWVIDQYQVSTDKRSGITNDPNRDDDKEYILRLIGQVITVSLETVKIVNALPDLGLPRETSAKATTTVQ